MVDMDVIQLIDVLEKTVSSDQNNLVAAQNFLENAVSSNLPNFLKLLSDILRFGGNSVVARMAAALQLKNQLTSRNFKVRKQYQQRWLQFPREIRNYIKNNILETLGTEQCRPSSAAQCVAYVAIAELPVNEWNDVITILVGKILHPSSSDMQIEATLEAIGYICQDIKPDILREYSNTILTAIIFSMKSTERNRNVRLAATHALLNSLEFSEANFNEENERNVIMEVICKTACCGDLQISVTALQCLVKIVALYYQYMEPFMRNHLFPIILEAIKSDCDAISLQGIEFWSTVSDVETDIFIEQSESTSYDLPMTRESKYYAKGASQHIVPLLMEKLLKYDDFFDDINWNPSKAAEVCLMLLSTCCEDEILPQVMPFINSNIKSENWRNKNAALLTFGSVLGGLRENTGKSLAQQALPVLIQIMHDSNTVVKETTAWVIGRICEVTPESVIYDLYLQPLIDNLVLNLKSKPRIAVNICWAITNLAIASYEAAAGNEIAAQPETFCLSVYFEFLITNLIETIDRSDACQSNLRTTAYEALMELVKNAPKDCYILVQKMSTVFLQRLQKIVQNDFEIVRQVDKNQFHNIQSMLFNTLQTVLRKVTYEAEDEIYNVILNIMLEIINFCTTANTKVDALIAISTLLEFIERNISKLVETFMPFIYDCLKSHQDFKICSYAITLTGEIFRKMKVQALPYCDNIMTILMEILNDHCVHRSVKSQIFTIFGDISLNIGSEFKKYLAVVLQTLTQASQIQMDCTDDENKFFFNDLRESILDAYSGIIRGLKGTGLTPHPDVEIIESQMPIILNFIITISLDETAMDHVIGATAGLIGDLLSAFGIKVVFLINQDSINNLLITAQNSQNCKTKTLATWALKEKQRLFKNFVPPTTSN